MFLNSMELNHNKGLAMKDNLVVQHNDLVTASYAMTRHEQNLLLSILARLTAVKRLDEGQVFTLTVEQSQRPVYNGNDQYNAYRDLKTASERLFERKIPYYSSITARVTYSVCTVCYLSLTQKRGR